MAKVANTNTRTNTPEAVAFINLNKGSVRVASIAVREEVPFGGNKSTNDALVNYCLNGTDKVKALFPSFDVEVHIPTDDTDEGTSVI